MILLPVVAAAAAMVSGVGAYYIGSTTAGPVPDVQIDRVLGFAAFAPGTISPVEPDHEVHLIIEPVEGSDIPQFYFEPSGLFIQPGDTVKFSFDTPDHTVTAYHSAHGFAPRIPDGVGPISSPILPPGGYWLYTFSEEGVYDLFCGPHQVFGMAMRIVVGSATGPGTSPITIGPPSEEPPFEPFLTAGLVLSDQALSPENIISKGQVSWKEVSPENKEIFLEFVE